jgi:hypothetical protein
LTTENEQAGKEGKMRKKEGYRKNIYKFLNSNGKK